MSHLYHMAAASRRASQPGCDRSCAAKCARRNCAKYNEWHVFISSGLVATRSGMHGFTKSFLVSDPDGHAMQLIERQMQLPYLCGRAAGA